MSPQRFPAVNLLAKSETGQEPVVPVPFEKIVHSAVRDQPGVRVVPATIAFMHTVRSPVADTWSS
jgi:hypothetical protein